MKFKKTLLTLGVASMMMQPVCAATTGVGAQDNPLLRKSALTFGAPDFSKIKETDYLPAIEYAVQQNREEINSIVNNKKKATFENTILALEKSGVLLDYIVNVFDGIANADKTPVIAETERKIMPMLTELDNEINFNEKLFKRIKYVYDKEFKSYLLGFPNREVREGFIRYLVPFYTPKTSQKAPFQIGNFIKEVRTGDAEGFMHRLESLFAGGDYQIMGNKEIYFQNVIYVLFQLMGLYVGVERHTANGRMDIVMQTSDFVYIFELKIDQTADAALRQIEEKQYASGFSADIYIK